MSKLVSDASGGVAAVVVLAMVGGLAFCKSPLAGGDLTIGWPHEVIGEVTTEPASRYVRSSEGSGQEKFAITIKTRGVPETLSDGYSAGELTLECLSTRCAQIQKGETPSFSTRVETSYRKRRKIHYKKWP